MLREYLKGDSVMTQTVDAIAINVGDEMRGDTLQFGEWSQVIERKSFRHGTRVWFRLANGLERTLCAATTIVINRADKPIGEFDARDLV